MAKQVIRDAVEKRIEECNNIQREISQLESLETRVEACDSVGWGSVKRMNSRHLRVDAGAPREEINLLLDILTLDITKGHIEYDAENSCHVFKGKVEVER